LETHLAGLASHFESEYRLQHRDGSWRWARSRGHVVEWSAGGSPLRFVGTQLDITGARASEEALVVAKVAAFAAARAKSEFLTVVSHELRTPLNAINGMATLLADTNLHGLQRDYVGTLTTSSHALLTTLNDILSLAALDSGNTRLESGDYDPRIVATEVLYEMRTAAMEKGLALQYDGPLEPHWVLGDAKAIRQILTHLVSNALKFTDNGWVNITSSLDAGRICFRVEDTGIGVPEEHLGRVFEPFAQVHPSFNRGHGDSGLGLAVCKRLVELLGGEIRLESIEGQGTSFEVTLPAPEASSKARPMSSSRDLDEDIDARLRARHPCVLVAEDNPVNQKVARAFLEKLGVRVECVGNGLEAVRAVTHFPYDLVLMDCQMPVMDGYDATEHLRALIGSARETPVVALTADAMDSARERCFAVGMDGFLTKPLQLPALRRALYETLLVGLRSGDPVAFSERRGAGNVSLSDDSSQLGIE
jgi:signal transduction histidine kinase/ActR/RegA family two-component response regulator